MNRDKYFYKAKKIRALEEEESRLRKLDRDTKEYLVLEKPVFAGWNIWIDFNDNFKSKPSNRRRVELITLLKLDKPRFIRKVKQVKFLRLCKYNYTKLRMLSFMPDNPIGSSRSWNIISEKSYNALPTVYHKYFTKHRKTEYIRDIPSGMRLYKYTDGYEYYLNSDFRSSELIVRTAKHYYSKTKIPNSDIESDLKYVKTVLEQRYRDRFTNTNHWRDIRAHNRPKYKSLCKVLTQKSTGYNGTEEIEFMVIKEGIPDLEYTNHFIYIESDYGCEDYHEEQLMRSFKLNKYRH